MKIVEINYIIVSILKSQQVSFIVVWKREY